MLIVGDADNTWESQNDIHPDLIAEFERHQLEVDASDAVYSTLGDDLPRKSRTSSSSRAESPPAKKKRKTSNSTVSTPSVSETAPLPPPPPPQQQPVSKQPSTTKVTNETSRKVFGVEKGWRVRAVIGAAKQKDSSVIYAVDYVQGSPVLREYVPSDVAHIYIPRELIEFFQKKIVWNSSSESKKI